MMQGQINDEIWLINGLFPGIYFHYSLVVNKSVHTQG